MFTTEEKNRNQESKKKMTVIDFREVFSEYDKEKPSLKDACNKNLHSLTGVRE